MDILNKKGAMMIGKKINAIALGVLGSLCVCGVAFYIWYLQSPIYVLSLLSHPVVNYVLQAIGGIAVVLSSPVFINFLGKSVRKNEYIKKKPVNVTSKDVTFLPTPFDQDLISAAEYVYMHYFSKQYPNENLNPPRPNHNILHALRTAAYVPDVIAYYQAFGEDKERFSRFDSNEIKKLQLLMLFNSAGRESEATSRIKPQYRKASGDAFEKYCRAMNPCFIGEHELKDLKDHLVRRGDPRFTDPVDIILNTAHNLDLLRCYNREQYFKSTIDYINAHSEKGINAVRQEVFERLLLKAQVLNRASGQPMSMELYLSPCGVLLYFEPSVPSDGKVFQGYSEKPLSFIEKHLLNSFTESVSVKCCTEEEERRQLFYQGQGHALNRLLDPIEEVQLTDGPLMRTKVTENLQKYIEELCESVTTEQMNTVKLADLIRKANWSHIILGKKEADQVIEWMHGLQCSAGKFSEPFNDDKRFDKDKGLFLIYGLKEALLSAYAYVGCESEIAVLKKQGYTDDDLVADGYDTKQIQDAEIKEDYENILAEVREIKDSKVENILAVVMEKYSVGELEYVLSWPKLNNDMKREMGCIVRLLELIVESLKNKTPCLSLETQIEVIEVILKTLTKNPDKGANTFFVMEEEHSIVKSLRNNAGRLCECLQHSMDMLRETNNKIKEHDSNKEKQIKLILKTLNESGFEISKESVREYFTTVSSEITDFYNKSLVERKGGHSLEELILKCGLDFYATLLLKRCNSEKPENLIEKVLKVMTEKPFEVMRGRLLSDLEKEAIHLYTSDVGYRCMNSILRGDMEKFWEQYSAKEKHSICYWFLMASFAASGVNKAPKIPSNEYCYRLEYVPDESSDFAKVLDGRRIAFSERRPVVQKGHTSFSLRRPADRFMGQIKMFGRNLNCVDASPFSDKDEREAILPAGEWLFFAAMKEDIYSVEQVRSPGCLAPN